MRDLDPDHFFEGSDHQEEDDIFDIPSDDDQQQQNQQTEQQQQPLPPHQPIISLQQLSVILEDVKQILLNTVKEELQRCLRVQVDFMKERMKENTRLKDKEIEELRNQHKEDVRQFQELSRRIAAMEEKIQK